MQSRWFCKLALTLLLWSRCLTLIVAAQFFPRLTRLASLLAFISKVAMRSFLALPWSCRSSRSAKAASRGARSRCPSSGRAKAPSAPPPPLPPGCLHLPQDPEPELHAHAAALPPPFYLRLLIQLATDRQQDIGPAVDKWLEAEARTCVS